MTEREDRYAKQLLRWSNQPVWDSRDSIFPVMMRRVARRLSPETYRRWQRYWMQRGGKRT